MDPKWLTEIKEKMRDLPLGPTVFVVKGGYPPGYSAGIFSTRELAEAVARPCRGLVLEFVLNALPDDLARHGTRMRSGDRVLVGERKTYMTRGPWFGWEGLVAWTSESNGRDLFDDKSVLLADMTPVAEEEG